MKFSYEKKVQTIVTGEREPATIHKFSLEGGSLVIEASERGVRITGESQYFQPVDEEMKIPDDFREFMTRLSSAFDLAWKEQKTVAKNSEALRGMLSIK